MIFRPADKDPKDRKLRKALQDCFGFQPKNLDIYKIALTHRSAVLQDKDSNERLEFLGDAVLDVVVGEAVYRRYSDGDEGYLTQMRSRIVSRDSLNRISEQTGLRQWMDIKGNDMNFRNIGGNMFEALSGAIFLDIGFEKCRKVLLNHLLSRVNWQELECTETDYKSRMVERCQKKGKSLSFRVRMLPQKSGISSLFEAEAVSDGSILGTGRGHSKKDAEQEASKQAWMREFNRGQDRDPAKPSTKI
ncbi:MAG: ribonuclease III [Bacteroidales bacterium]|jgi:ribonuclease-3|nr:ribonuclease III [Bacteroidales bacterium]MDD2263577.1 ribonuclease III [Bacteroidales bacterium]MDD2830632.1 ribonuclease III [Bacteroidales bacterium]MDD3208901.1 ribonuclease III [Bacteroidales bacterium]MDD3697374.1 ribonuclease III [Bacteroidales bacterium]